MLNDIKKIYQEPKENVEWWTNNGSLGSWVPFGKQYTFVWNCEVLLNARNLCLRKIMIR